MMDPGWLAFACGVVALLLCALGTEPLYLLGVDLILGYPKLDWLQLFNNLVSALLGPVLVVLALLAKPNSMQAFNFFFALCSSLYLLSMLKVLFSQSRPFWSDSEVEKRSWDCPLDFGNPSGHSWLSVFIFDQIFNQFPSVFVLGSQSLAMGVLVAQSRMGLGVHSLNQVLLGLVLGLASVILYRRYSGCVYLLFLKVYHREVRLHTIIIAQALTFLATSLVLSAHAAPSADNCKNIAVACGIEEAQVQQLTEHQSSTACSVINLAFSVLYYFYMMGEDQAKQLLVEKRLNLVLSKPWLMKLGSGGVLYLGSLMLGGLAGMLAQTVVLSLFFVLDELVQECLAPGQL